jgi:membrane protein implicated in regulation of membrane protease activity
MRWWSAFVIGWPIAVSTAYLAIPFVRSLTSTPSPQSKEPKQFLAGRLDVVVARRLRGTRRDA